MDYYDRKTRAIELIDKFYEKGVSILQATYAVEKQFGLGRSFVKKRYELLDEMATDTMQNQNG